MPFDMKIDVLQVSVKDLSLVKADVRLQLSTKDKVLLKYFMGKIIRKNTSKS